MAEVHMFTKERFGVELVLTFVASVDGRRRLARVKVKVGDVDEQRMVLGKGSPFRADRTEPFVHHLVHEPHMVPHVGSGVLGSLAEWAGHVPEGGEEVGQPMHVHISLGAELLQALWTLGNFLPVKMDRVRKGTHSGR